MNALTENVVRLGKLADFLGISEIAAAEYIVTNDCDFENEFIKFCEEYINNGGNFNGF